MQRRLERDLERVHTYYTDLRQESWQRLTTAYGLGARALAAFEAAEA